MQCLLLFSIIRKIYKWKYYQRDFWGEGIHPGEGFSDDKMVMSRLFGAKVAKNVVTSLRSRCRRSHTQTARAFFLNFSKKCCDENIIKSGFEGGSQHLYLIFAKKVEGLWFLWKFQFTNFWYPFCKLFLIWYISRFSLFRKK